MHVRAAAADQVEDALEAVAAADDGAGGGAEDPRAWAEHRGQDEAQQVQGRGAWRLRHGSPEHAQKDEPHGEAELHAQLAETEEQAAGAPSDSKHERLRDRSFQQFERACKRPGSERTAGPEQLPGHRAIRQEFVGPVAELEGPRVSTTHRSKEAHQAKQIS